jgi:hypothetical protein
MIVDRRGADAAAMTQRPLPFPPEAANLCNLRNLWFLPFRGERL